MNIADAVNPFFFQLDTDPVKDAATQLITTAGQTTIYSALDEVTIANHTAAAGVATVVEEENDLTIYSIDVVLASDLLHQDRGPQASRNIAIYCRKLTVLGSADQGLTIDVSGYSDEKRNIHKQPDPDKSATLTNPSQKATPGDDIAYALNHPTKDDTWSNWFDNNPGKGWGMPGATGGTINIACETLELHQKLHLKANGGPGNAGIGGQSVQNWMPGLVGGDAGRGGRGGDSGTIELYCNNVVDQDGKVINLTEWVDTECSAGPTGDPGLPGFAYDPSQKNRHYGSYAESVEPGASRDAELIEPADLPYAGDSGEASTADLSMVSTGSDLHFWALLYHRIKLEYLENQPLTFQMPSATDASWMALGTLLKWSHRFCFPYGDTKKDLKQQCCGDVANDPDLDDKNKLARGLKLILGWYLAGKTMWGKTVTTVFPLPFSTLCGYVDDHFKQQKSVQQFFITLRRELANAIKSHQDLTTMSNAAEYAVQSHKNTVDDLKSVLFGETTGGGVDAQSLLGELNAADAACNVGITKLATDLGSPELDEKVKDACGIGVNDVLESLKSMCFVAGDAKGFMAMGAMEGYGLYQKAKDNVTDDAGNSLAKDAVIKEIHELKGGVDDLAQLAVGMVRNAQIGKLDQAILTSLDNIDSYVSKFTTALGAIGKTILDQVQALRTKVNDRNEVWLEYNDTLYQLAKEWEEYQTALAHKQEIDTSSQQELSANLVNAVELYTTIYLTNLERSADLWAKLMRKYAYVTLGAVLPSKDFLGDLTAFWDADGAAAQGIADQADNNWDIDNSAIVGSQKSSSIRYRLALYNSGSQSIVLHAPDPTDPVTAHKKSDFYVSIRGSSDSGGKIINKLLQHEPVWLQVVPPASFDGKYTDENGAVCDPPEISSNVYACPLISGNDWDVRITHVNPWIEGVRTNSKPEVVEFEIKIGTKAYIIDTKKIAHYFAFENLAVNTQFAHSTNILLSDPTNDGMAGDAAGEVTDENSEKRGIFVQIQLTLPDNELNKGLRAATNISHVNMNVHFRVIFRAPVKSQLS
jgi:hypothetical protein